MEKCNQIGLFLKDLDVSILKIKMTKLIQVSGNFKEAKGCCKHCKYRNVPAVQGGNDQPSNDNLILETEDKNQEIIPYEYCIKDEKQLAKEDQLKNGPQEEIEEKNEKNNAHIIKEYKNEQENVHQIEKIDQKIQEIIQTASRLKKR